MNAIAYIHPCIVCDVPTGSEHDLPTVCLDCSGHECERHWLANDPTIGWCGICDRDWNLT